MEETYESLVDNAYNLHVSGNLNEAKAAYEKLLEINPNDLNVLNLYAQLNFSLKNYDISLKIFNDLDEKTHLDEIKENIIKVYSITNDYENVIKTANLIKQKSTSVLRLLADAYLELKNFQETINTYLKILNTNEASLSDIYNLSIAYYKNNDFDNALKYALEVYNQNDKDESICIHLAAIYRTSDDKENQLKYLLKAAEIKPSVDLFYNIGVLYRQIGDNDSALAFFKEIVEVDPNHKYAYLNIAKIFQDYDKKVSIDIYSNLASKYPDDIMILTQLYIMYTNIFDYKKAYETVLKIIELKPEEEYSYSFAADSLYGMGKYEEAITMYEKAAGFSQSPKYCDMAIANIYSILNQPQKAFEIFDKKYPDLKKDDDTYAFIQLREKNLDEAREAIYKHFTEVKTKDFIEKRALQFFYKLNVDKKYGINEHAFKELGKNKKYEELERLKYHLKKDLYKHNPQNKRILVYNANGNGDMIMFSRYIHILENYTKNIVIQTPKSMQRLMQYNFPEYEIIPNEEKIDRENYDYSTSFCNLLLNFKENSLKNIPYADKYLSVPDELIKEKSQLDIMRTKKKKIGIFWMGNPVVMQQRCMKLKHFVPLFDVEKTQIYSFQIGNFDFDAEDLMKTLPLIDLKEYIKDYADTGAFLENIDVLVTIDTSIANLSGAMGIKTYLLLPYDSEWRWFHDSEKTPWYSSVRIFKQKIPYDWNEVIERVKNEL